MKPSQIVSLLTVAISSVNNQLESWRRALDFFIVSVYAYAVKTALKKRLQACHEAGLQSAFFKNLFAIQNHINEA